MSAPLGCAQNADGTLKEAHEIIWQHSRSSSPVDFSFAPSLPMPSTGIPQKEPTHGKAPKQQTRKRNRNNPIQCKTPASAVTEPKKQNQLSLDDKLKIIEFTEDEGKGLSQTAIAKHFHTRGFPGLSQTTVGDALGRQAIIRAALNPGGANGLQVGVKLAPGVKRMQKIQYPEVEDILHKWQLQQEGLGRTVTGPLLVEKA